MNSDAEGGRKRAWCLPRDPAVRLDQVCSVFAPRTVVITHSGSRKKKRRARRRVFVLLERRKLGSCAIQEKNTTNQCADTKLSLRRVSKINELLLLTICGGDLRERNLYGEIF